MRKVFGLLILAAFFSGGRAYAGGNGSGFLIEGPQSLKPGETGTYIVKADIYDAAAAQAMLEYDGSVFELAGGNPSGEWDNDCNVSRTVELTSVQLKVKDDAPAGTYDLSLSDFKAARLTDSVPPVEEIDTAGTSFHVAIEGIPAATVSAGPSPGVPMFLIIPAIAVILFAVVIIVVLKRRAAKREG